MIRVFIAGMFTCLLISSCEVRQNEGEQPSFSAYTCGNVPKDLPEKTNKLIVSFCSLDGNTTDTLVASYLDSIRMTNSHHEVLGQIVSAKLKENDPLYQGRGPQEVIRLRAYLLSTLGSLEVPDSAIPYILSELTQNQHKSPILVASAARASRGVTQYHELLADHLRKYLSERQMDDILDLDHYNVWPPISPTSIREEVLRTIIEFGPRASKAQSELETALKKSKLEGSVYNRRKELQLLVSDAYHSVQQIGNVTICKDKNGMALFASRWSNEGDRFFPDVFAYEIIDHMGNEGEIEQYRGKPMIATFFYTRCGNLNKCSMTVSKLVKLEKDLLECGIKDFNILGFSLDPVFDTPQHMRTFAENRGIGEDSHVSLLKLSNLQHHEAFLQEMNAAVSYQASSMVSFHGVELLLLDKNGGFVRKYLDHTKDRQMVVEDMKRLRKEG